tara:strand:+ start:11264 stop:11764 length:501 start_codon:yes stop_codon:yes gene_type:complete
MTKIEITNRVIELMNYCKENAGEGKPWSEEERTEFHEYFYDNMVNVEEGGKKYYNINLEPGARQWSTGVLYDKVYPDEVLTEQEDLIEDIKDEKQDTNENVGPSTTGNEGLSDDWPNFKITEYDSAVIITADYDPESPEILKKPTIIIEFNSENKITLMKQYYNAT